MKNLLLLPAMLCMAPIILTAQNPALNCNSGRYVSDVFPAVTKTTGIIFGYNTSTDYITSTTYNHTLKLDFYEPASDPTGKRPLIILAFGGSFVYGLRSDLDAICTAFSKKGYATATIDYRLIQPGTANANYLFVYSNPALLADEVVKTAADMKAAIRFFKHDAATANTFKIDPSKIFIGGYSAGAITALQTAYTDDVNENTTVTAQYLNNGGLEGNTDLHAPDNLLPAYQSSGIAGVLNIAGGIADTNLIDAINPPVYSAQGDADLIVPYNFGTTGFSPLSLYGSHLIQMRANNNGLLNQLFTIGGGNHESPVTQPHFSQVIEGAALFFAPIVCSASILPVVLTSFTATADHCAAVLHWQTAAEQQSSHYDIEASVDGARFIKMRTVQSENRIGGSSYTYRYEAPAGTLYIRLKMVDKEGGFVYSPVQKLKTTCLGAVQVYPNPARTQTTLTRLETGMQISLFNAEGRLLWAQKAAGRVAQVPLANFANGLYLLRITDNAGKAITDSRLIKQ